MDNGNNVDASEFNCNYDEVVTTFDKMGLKNELLRGIYSYGFEKPSAIQQRAIKPSIEGRDVIAQAQSGTGKTATFAISILQKINPELNCCQALVLCPTRELAKQIRLVVDNLGAHMSVNCHTCIGGTETRSDIQALERGPQVVVGTPGRVFSLMKDRNLPTADISMFVLDEADEMLSRGFEDQIRDVYNFIPATAQVMLLSATMPTTTLAVANKIMNDPVRILVKKEELTLDGISQYYVRVVEAQHKIETLMDLYQTMNLSQVVIFVNTVRRANALYEELRSRNFDVSLMTGELEQEGRDIVMAQYREGKSRILLSTDVLARGIDVQSVSLVINYDLPSNREVYIHSGRFGRKGKAINFVTDSEMDALNELMNYYNTEIIELPSMVASML